MKRLIFGLLTLSSISAFGTVHPTCMLAIEPSHFDSLGKEEVRAISRYGYKIHSKDFEKLKDGDLYLEVKNTYGYLSYEFIDYGRDFYFRTNLEGTTRAIVSQKGLSKTRGYNAQTSKDERDLVDYGRNQIVFNSLQETKLDQFEMEEKVKRSDWVYSEINAYEDLKGCVLQ